MDGVEAGVVDKCVLGQRVGGAKMHAYKCVTAFCGIALEEHEPLKASRNQLFLIEITCRVLCAMKTQEMLLEPFAGPRPCFLYYNPPKPLKNPEEKLQR